MNFADPVIEAGVAGLAAAFADGSARPDVVLEAYLERVGRLNPTIKAFVDLDVEGARNAAKTSAHRWASGTALSAHGLSGQGDLPCTAARREHNDRDDVENVRFAPLVQ